MLNNFYLTFQAFFKPFFWGLLVKSFFSYLLLAISIFWGVHFLVNNTHIFSTGWLETSVDIFSQALVPFLAWLLFPILFPAILSIFQDSIVSKTHKSFYPNSPLGKNPNSFSSTLTRDIKFLLISLFINLLFLPLYLIPVINIILYVAINGFLIGRECYDIAASRFISWDAVDLLRNQKRKSIYFHGVLITLLALIPLVNLVAPLVALIVMVHLYKQHQ